ncbi:MAG: tetratricopeptide repeat protein [Desulfohalobiaceae bacterium]|nr:tetratricopeptide repeat protein [Desulfohalobiaceae bacterium]
MRQQHGHGRQAEKAPGRRKTSPVFFWVLLCFFLLSTGCARPPADTTHTRIKVPEMSSRAEAAFFYLKYRDLLQKDQPELAGRALSEALARDPDPELYLEQATYYWRQKKYSKAVSTLLSGLDEFPGNRRLTLTLSRVFQDRDQDQKALEVLNHYVADHPRDTTGLRRLARLYLKMKEYDKAEAVVKNIPKADWTASEHYLMAQVYSALEKREQTVEHLEEATRLKPAFAKAWAELGYQHELAGDYVRAEKAYSRLLDLDAANKEIYIRLIELNLKLNSPKKGIELVKQGPAEQDFLIRALALFLQNEFTDQALRFFELFDAKITKSPEGKFYKALTFFRARKDMDYALQLLNEIEPGQEMYAQVLSLKSRLFWEKGNYKQAVAAAEHGQELFPEQERFWLLQSEILKSQDRPQEALAVLQQAVQRFEDSLRIHFQAGVQEYELGHRQKALELMERVLEIDPGHAPAMNFIGYSLVEKGQDLQRAFELISDALKKDPNNGYYLDSLAWYYYQRENFEKAWEVISSALAAEEKDPIIWEHYAEIARKLEKEAEARQGYQKAIELGAENKEELEQKLLGL